MKSTKTYFKKIITKIQEKIKKSKIFYITIVIHSAMVVG